MPPQLMKKISSVSALESGAAHIAIAMVESGEIDEAERAEDCRLVSPLPCRVSESAARTDPRKILIAVRVLVRIE